jgi:hypothetical protein
MNGTAENACSKSNLEKRISAYDHSTISECFGWGGVNSAQFSMRWRSLNKDAVKISYGWCPDRCSSYRSGSCTWGSERDEKGTNFEQSLSATVNNRHWYAKEALFDTKLVVFWVTGGRPPAAQLALLSTIAIISVSIWFAGGSSGGVS